MRIHQCVRNSTEPGCSHLVFPADITYSHVWASMESYWCGFPDGFLSHEGSRPSSPTINDNYVDSISLTYGNTPNRTHIWTFIADTFSFPRSICKIL